RAFSLFTASQSSDVFSLSLHDALPIYEYAIMVNAGDKNADKWTAFQEDVATGSAPYTVLKKDRDAHIVHDKVSQTTGYALFEERSEEHTSELQSRFDLVCRLLLEKKKE